MITIYKTKTGKLNTLKEIEKGTWVKMINPNEEEIDTISKSLSIDKDDILSVLDAEESARLDINETYHLIIIDAPFIIKKNHINVYKTIPIAFFLTKDLFLTVCISDNDVFEHFLQNKEKQFDTEKPIEAILHFLLYNTSLYIKYLYLIDEQSDLIEETINRSSKNKELIKLLYLEKSLIFFSNSLNSNHTVFKKLHRLDNNRTQEEIELLEDLLIENKQAIEMTKTYREILSGIMDFFSSYISNNLNVVMKSLTSITLILYIPTLISSLFGMNVPLPFMKNVFALPILLLISFSVSVLVAFFMKSKDLL